MAIWPTRTIEAEAVFLFATVEQAPSLFSQDAMFSCNSENIMTSRANILQFSLLPSVLRPPPPVASLINDSKRDALLLAR